MYSNALVNIPSISFQNALRPSFPWTYYYHLLQNILIQI